MYNRQLDTFLVCADRGSFAKAGEELFISTPAVIQQINLLEERLGFPLFRRSNRGIRLTQAGEALYQDARRIVRLSGEAIARGRALAQTVSSTVRIGTSLLFKCRMLPDLWAKAAARCPDLKLELLPMPEHESCLEGQRALGSQYDIREGIFCTISQAGTCAFLELMKTPLCCAVSREHRLAKYSSLRLGDLNGEVLMMPIAHISLELDAFRRLLQSEVPTASVVDSSYYGVDTFALCEMNQYILITQQVYADIHPNLITIPLETDIQLPYGLMYALNPSPATRRFVDAVRA